MIKKALTILAIIILALIIKSRLDVITSLKDTGATREDIEQALKHEKESNAYLSEQLKYVQSKDYIELEAREKLNLTKKGEVLVLTNLEEKTNEKPMPSTEKIIWKKWVNLLF